ncbi:MAG TPA: DUF1801 domain-containing protein [Dermatophilaceae bacterium]|nr:DUF1801 domain-containing protein [Dermatophilaceae bacterium]
MSDSTAARDVDAVLGAVPEPERSALLTLRSQVRELVPEADEGIAYGLPCFRLGRPFLGYGPRRGGCSLYPMSGGIIERFADRLEAFRRTKGAIHFTADRPLPADLVADIVRARLDEIRDTGH